MPYVYEPRPRIGNAQPKHKWRNKHPDVVEAPGGEKVGMCPAGIPKETLEHLLNSGIQEFAAGGQQEHPKAIYNIYGGVPYKAVKTQLGKSFHGFPCVSKRKDVSTRIYRQLLALAEEKGVKAEVERWFKAHP